MDHGILYLRTLGGLDLRCADGTEMRSILAQPKRLAFLLYLAAATPRGFHRKDTLKAMFWPESDDEHTRRALNRSAYVLRHELGRDLLSSRGDEDLSLAEGRLWCDAAAFEQAIDQGRPEDALELYRGDFAPGFFVDGLPDFERWVEAERRRLRDLALGAALGLAEREEATGELAVASRWAHRAITLAPHDEGAIRRSIMVLDRAGDRAGALRAYEEFAARLRADFEVAPSPETRALLEAVQSRQQAGPVIRDGKVPANRFATAADLRETGGASPETSSGPTAPPADARSGIRHPLPALAATSGVVLLAAIGWSAFTTGPLPTAKRRAVAVLPCENLSRDQRYADVGDRWTEELILKLSKVSDLQVKPWPSVRRYKDTNKGLKQIAAELAAETLVRCSVAETEDSVRLALQLIAADREAIVWSAEYQRELTAASLNTVQGEAARSSAVALAAALSPGQLADLDRPPTHDLQAWDLYRRGRQLQFMLTVEGLPKSIQHYDQAIARDSAFALAYAAKADALQLLLDAGIGEARDVMPQVGELARKALEIDESLAEAHTALADYLFYFNWDWPTAEHHYRRAVRVNPSSVYAHIWYALALRTVDRHDDAVAAAQRGVELDPADPLVRTQLSAAYAEARQYDRALEEARKAVELDPRTPFAHLGLSITFGFLGQHDSAIAAAERADQLYGGLPGGRANLALVYAVAGRRDRAEGILEELRTRSRKEELNPFHFAIIHAALGNRDEAFSLLEKAYQERTYGLVFALGVSPLNDFLQDDPRYEHLRRRVGFNEWRTDRGQTKSSARTQ